jgi:hypothetical protein
MIKKFFDWLFRVFVTKELPEPEKSMSTIPVPVPSAADPVTAGLTLASDVVKLTTQLQAEKNTAAEVLAKTKSNEQAALEQIETDVATKNTAAFEKDIAG